MAEGEGTPVALHARATSDRPPRPRDRAAGRRGLEQSSPRSRKSSRCPVRLRRRPRPPRPCGRGGKRWPGRRRLLRLRRLAPYALRRLEADTSKAVCGESMGDHRVGGPSADRVDGKFLVRYRHLALDHNPWGRPRRDFSARVHHRCLDGITVKRCPPLGKGRKPLGGEGLAFAVPDISALAATCISTQVRPIAISDERHVYFKANSAGRRMWSTEPRGDLGRRRILKAAAPSPPATRARSTPRRSSDTPGAATKSQTARGQSTHRSKVEPDGLLMSGRLRMSAVIRPPPQLPRGYVYQPADAASARSGTSRAGGSTGLPNRAICCSLSRTSSRVAGESLLPLSWMNANVS
jgi:hypothetical protein